MKKIAILGATGSVGVYTTIMLKNQGYDVYAIGHRKSDNGFFGNYGISYFSINLEDYNSFKVLPKSVDVVLHFAGAMPARMKGYNPYSYVDTIIKGTLNVLEYMREIGCRRIVFTHSIADVGYKFGTLEPIDAYTNMKFPLATDHSIYSISKNAAVHLLEHYHAQYKFETFVLRLPTIYVYQPNPFFYLDGEKKWFAFRYIIEQAIKGEELEIWGNPDSAKEMVYVLDFVHMIQCCIDAENQGGIYNVGTGKPVSIEYQIHKIAEVFNTSKKSNIVYCPDKPSSPQFVLDISNAKRELGYNPKYNFDKLLLDYKKELETEPYALLWGFRKDFID